MNAIKNLIVAGMIGAAAAGGYSLSSLQHSDSDYRIERKEGKVLLYSRSTGGYHEIQNIAGNIIVGSAKENLNGYDVLRTKEIAEIVIKQYLGQTNQPNVKQGDSKKQDSGILNLEEALKKAFLK
jgi:hypothetical protein